MGGLDIIARDKKGDIKQDYHVFRDPIKGKIVEEDTLKIEEEKNKKEKENPGKEKIGLNDSVNVKLIKSDSNKLQEDKQ